MFIWFCEPGTKLKYKPGIVMGGRHLVHDCGTSRSIGYFLEPLIVLGLFGKKPLTIRLRGIFFCCLFMRYTVADGIIWDGK